MEVEVEEEGEKGREEGREEGGREGGNWREADPGMKQGAELGNTKPGPRDSERVRGGPRKRHEVSK